MKVSILTPTYNRASYLEKVYNSLVINTNCGVDFEWLIMDDGSTDNTEVVVQNYISQGIVNIKYYKQHNMCKMTAINNLMNYVTGDICLTCDSDDYLATGALDIIRENADRLLKDDTVYALAFLKQKENGKIAGDKFPEDFHRTDMFSLYFRECIDGEFVLVFKTEIRKQYHHEIEADEKFITERRMYHKMDLDHDIIGINKAIEVGDYLEDGYTKNITHVFKQNPLGYFMYFREILDLDLTGVKFNKKMYLYKHFILFSNLAERSHTIRETKGLFNKFMLTLLWIPGTLATKKRFSGANNFKNDAEEDAEAKGYIGSHKHEEEVKEFQEKMKKKEQKKKADKKK